MKTNTMSENKNDGIDLSHVIEIPGAAQFEKAVNSWSKRVMASMWADIKRHLSTASEPFHRKQMGERYYSSEALGGSLVIWILSSMVTFLLFLPLGVVGFQAPRYLLASTFLSCGAMCVATLALGSLSIGTAERYRNEGRPYHSRSRGVPLYGSYTPLVILGIAMLLLVFNPLTGIAFIASLMFSAKLSAEQQAAIFSRYLDAVDQKIENEHLEGAILGEFPIEQTFLHKPLPPYIPTEVRKDMAAAAVGKPVKFMARPPQPTAGSKPPDGPAATTTLQPDEPLVRPPAPVKPPTIKSAAPLSKPVTPPVEKAASIPQPHPEKVEPRPASKSSGFNINITLRKAVAVFTILFISIALAFGISHYRHTLIHRSPVSAPLAAAPAVVIQEPPTVKTPAPPPPAVKVEAPKQGREPPARAPTVVVEEPQQIPAPVVPPPAVTIQEPRATALSVPPVTAQVKPESQMLAARLASLFTNEVQAMNEFTNYYAVTIALEKNSVEKLRDPFKKKLAQKIQNNQWWIDAGTAKEEQFLNGIKPILDGAGTQEDLQKTLADLEKSIQPMDEFRQSVSNALVPLDAEIYNTGLRR